PEIGPDHAAPFHADTQEHVGLDELLYQMSTCPPAEFASLASTYKMTQGGHDSGGASSSHAPPRPRRRRPHQMSIMHRGFRRTHLLRLSGFQCSIRAALGPSTRLHRLTRHPPRIIVSHSMGTAHLPRRGRSCTSTRQIHPSPQRLHRHLSPVALPGLSDRHREAPEATGIPLEETVRASFCIFPSLSCIRNLMMYIFVSMY
ncbi:hypothetical protein PIB30_108988, partial [Stylosanthes scabra]|nr:hypothetical protein [Stylosanthes scabra]